MVLSEYEAKRQELDALMDKFNKMESEKKMELSIKYQADCKRIQSEICNLKRKQKELLKDYQNNKAWWHEKFKEGKRDVSAKIHLLRLEYLTVNNISCKETNTPPSSEKQRDDESRQESENE